MVMNVSGALAAYRQTMTAGRGVSGGVEPSATGVSFSDTLKSFVGDTVEGLKGAEKVATEGAAGKANVQEIVVAMTKAEVDFNTIISLRDKFLTAYQEIMRTTV